MRVVTIQFVIEDQFENALDHELEHSQLLNDWPVFQWSSKEATPEQVEWYKEEYLDEDHNE